MAFYILMIRNDFPRYPLLTLVYTSLFILEVMVLPHLIFMKFDSCDNIIWKHIWLSCILVWFGRIPSEGVHHCGCCNNGRLDCVLNLVHYVC